MLNLNILEFANNPSNQISGDDNETSFCRHSYWSNRMQR